jgi:acyl-CoA thioesterase FadM
MQGPTTRGRGLLTPEGAFTLHFAARSYEVNAWGTIGPGTVLRYLEHLATQASRERGFDHAWYERHGSAWVVREMALLLHALPSIDDELVMATWLSEYRRVQAFREYVIWRRDGGQLVARAQARWAYVDRTRGQLARIPEAIRTTLGTAGQAMRPLTRLAPRDAVAAHVHAAMTLTARRYEMDSQLHVNNCVYVDWLEEALRAAVTPVPDADLMAGAWLLPRAFHIEYVAQTRAGDHVTIETTWDAPSPRGVFAAQRIASHAGDTLVRARSLYLRSPRRPAS